MKRNFRTISVILIISLLVTALTSCGDLFLKTPDAPQRQTGSVSGTISTVDALPENKAGSGPRAAFATADFDNNYEYKVWAQDNKETKIEGTVYNTENSGKAFSISDLVFGTEYTIYASVQRKDDKDDNVTVLEGSSEKTVKLTTDNPTANTININVKPLTEGTGNISLTVLADTAGDEMPQLTKVTAILEKKSGEDFTETTKDAEFISDENVQKATITFEKIPLGGRKLTLYFYKEDDLVYRCPETVNVTVNMTTDKWVKTGDEKWLSTSGNTTNLYITKDLVNSFETSRVYIDSNYAGEEETGSIYKPFTTLEAALKRLSSIPENKYIFIKNDSSLSYNGSLSIGNNFTIEAYTNKAGDYSTSETKPSFTLTAENGYSFTVSSGKELTVNGMNIASDTTNPQTGSFFTVESGAEATFANCSFNNRNASEGSAVKNAGSATFSSCSFEGNSASSNGGAVYNTGSATFSSCTFKDNSAAAGGAIIYNSNQLTLENCTISYNSQTTAPTAILSEGESEAGPLITIKGTGNSIAGTIVLKDRSGIKIAESQNDTKKLGTLDISEHSEDENSLQFLTTANGLSVAEAQKCFEGFILGDYQDKPQEGKLVLYPNDAVYVAPSTSNSAAAKGSFQNPYTTISAALNALNSKTGTDATTVYIKGGTTSPIEYNWSENITLTRSATLKVYGTTPAETGTGTATIKPETGYGFTIGTSGTDAGSITFEAEGLFFDDSTSQAATSGFVTIGSNVSSASFTNCQFNNCHATSETAAFSTSASVTLNSCSFSNNVASGGNAGIAIAVNPGAVLTLKGSISLGEGLQIQACSSKTGTINLDGTFTTGDAKIPLSIEDISLFTEENSYNSPFTGDSTKFDSFILTGHDGYAFDSTGHIVRPGAGGAIKLPEKLIDDQISVSCERDEKTLIFKLTSSGQSISISDCWVEIWNSGSQICSETPTYFENTDQWCFDFPEDILISGSVPPGHYDYFFGFVINNEIHTISVSEKIEGAW